MMRRAAFPVPPLGASRHRDHIHSTPVQARRQPPSRRRIRSSSYTQPAQVPPLASWSNAQSRVSAGRWGSAARSPRAGRAAERPHRPRGPGRPELLEESRTPSQVCARPAVALERVSLHAGRDGGPERIRYSLPRHKRGTWIGPGRKRQATARGRTPSSFSRRGSFSIDSPTSCRRREGIAIATTASSLRIIPCARPSHR